MKRIVVSLLLLALLGGHHLQAQTQDFHFDFHGFVNPHYYADSRSVVGGREDMMLFYPKPVTLDGNGTDIHDGWQANMLAITARLGLRVSGPDMLGAKTSAYIEGDFTGATNATIDNLRLRHAYLTLDWGKHHLLAGQYWYAMVIHEIMPMTNPLNMGAPFHCYARQPQVRYTFRHHRWEAVAVAQWQLDNMSQGLLNGTPQSSTLFARHSLVPEFTAQLRYRQDRLFVGLAANLKTIQPIVNTTGLAAEQQLYSSPTFSLFGSYRFNGFTLKAQTLLNNSLYEGCSLGGYVLVTDLLGRYYDAYDWHFNTFWLDLERNKGHWRPGLFMGYAHNMDGTDKVSSAALNYTYLGRGHDLAYLWRVQPRLTYTTLQGLSFVGEMEYTYAGYATPVGNTRLSLSVVYAF